MLIALVCTPSVKTLIIIHLLAFGGALIAYAVAVIALRRARMRRLAADPYAREFGDQPPVDHLRAFMGPRQ